MAHILFGSRYLCDDAIAVALVRLLCHNHLNNRYQLRHCLSAQPDQLQDGTVDDSW